MLVDIINFELDSSVHVHSATCTDPSRKAVYKQSDYRRYGNEPVEVKDIREVVDFVFGPEAGSFYEEQGLDDATGWKHQLGEFRFFACIADLPADTGR